MVKGNCVKRKKEPMWTREVGRWLYLKNCRKGLRYQQEQRDEYLRNAVDAATADSSTKRLQWVIHKQRLLDNDGAAREGFKNTRDVRVCKLHASSKNISEGYGMIPTGGMMRI